MGQGSRTLKREYLFILEYQSRFPEEEFSNLILNKASKIFNSILNRIARNLAPELGRLLFFELKSQKVSFPLQD
jgi:hypothetical protein